jgi:Spy/CpxP family protein refolding chaperone
LAQRLRNTHFKQEKNFLKEDKKMKKTVVALGLVAVMLVGVSYVYARGPGFGPGHGQGQGPGQGPGAGPGNCPGCEGTLNLTPEQQTQMKELRQKHFDEMAPVREEMFKLRQELRALWAKPGVTKEEIQAKTQQMNQYRDQMQDKMVEHRLEAQKLLTPDQISAMGAGPGKGRRGGRGFGPGRGGCY